MVDPKSGAWVLLCAPVLLTGPWTAPLFHSLAQLTILEATFAFLPCAWGSGSQVKKFSELMENRLMGISEVDSCVRQ